VVARRRLRCLEVARHRRRRRCLEVVRRRRRCLEVARRRHLVWARRRCLEVVRRTLRVRGYSADRLAACDLTPCVLVSLRIVLPKKRVIKPSVKLRGLNWQPIKKIDGTVWEETDDEKVKIDLGELEELFCQAKAPKPEDPNGAAKPTGPAKPQVVSLLDMKRSQNLCTCTSCTSPCISLSLSLSHIVIILIVTDRCLLYSILAIMLSRFGKLSFAEIRKAIEDLDETILTPENVAALKGLAPDAEEIAMLKEYTGDVSQLGKPEQFVLAIADIPRLIPRLNALAIRSTFQGKLDAVKAVRH